MTTSSKVGFADGSGFAAMVGSFASDGRHFVPGLGKLKGKMKNE